MTVLKFVDSSGNDMGLIRYISYYNSNNNNNNNNNIFVILVGLLFTVLV